MDRLARNAMLARQANMSYGKWKAMQPVVEVVKPEIPEGWSKCEECGVAFKPKRSKRFCDVTCRMQNRDNSRAKKDKRAEYMRQYREEKKHEQAKIVGD